MASAWAYRANPESRDDGPEGTATSRSHRSQTKAVITERIRQKRYREAGIGAIERRTGETGTVDLQDPKNGKKSADVATVPELGARKVCRSYY